MVLAVRAANPSFCSPCYGRPATLYLDKVDSSRAERYMRKVQEICERAGLEPDDLPVLPFLL